MGLVVERYEGLEATTANLRQLLGEDAARRLFKTFGGRRLYVPRDPGGSHPIVVALGADAGAQLAAAFHGSTISVPMAPDKQAEIRRLDAAGRTRREIATEVGCTERWVYKTLEDAETSAPAQPGFFD